MACLPTAQRSHHDLHASPHHGYKQRPAPMFKGNPADMKDTPVNMNGRTIHPNSETVRSMHEATAISSEPPIPVFAGCYTVGFSEAQPPQRSPPHLTTLWRQYFFFMSPMQYPLPIPTTERIIITVRHIYPHKTPPLLQQDHPTLHPPGSTHPPANHEERAANKSDDAPIASSKHAAQ
ncbi:hypothetical protein BDK51DRAFT_45993 [Blyttiomyces helicus]|uniref:Uncharacterized protein n=1 Tax=Blyttiomyces helicus TaxID=388810 RepID=A0A4P9WN73_9FUNG|nr:hypothetical protein BDK51DRAFT_45993 [Blyttiomyces helicus]|eukprot:RKO94561.1 hypothetical protein BDK51DRAFT_45993 [Blyttiomyces helicus]